MKKKIMILGAGVYQVPLIKKSKELGYETLVVSYEGNYPGFQFSDKNIYEDTTAYEKVAKIAQNENIDGVCTAGTDVALITLGKICDELNLSGPSFEAVQLSTDKKKMKDAFINSDVRTAKYFNVSTLDQSNEAFKKLNKPAIFKAVDSSGSRGIIRVDKESEISAAFDYVMETTKKDYFIIEEFIIGEEFGAQAFILNDEIKFIMPHGDMIFQGSTGVPIGHYVPYNLSTEIQRDIETQLKYSIHALKLNNCAINADFILSDNKVYVLEIGARTGATCLAEMVGIHFGFDYFEYVIKNCLGIKMEVHFKNKKIPCAGELLTSSQSGTITKITNENLMKQPYIEDISFDYKVNDQINKFNVGPDRIGQIIVTGNTLEESLNNLEFVKEKIKIELK
nr:ATP-grasp domain-containing protein [Candidatus Prometheoarchaeum syntrophicum]